MLLSDRQNFHRHVEQAKSYCNYSSFPHKLACILRENTLHLFKAIQGNTTEGGRKKHCENMMKCIGEFWNKYGFRRVPICSYIHNQNWIFSCFRKPYQSKHRTVTFRYSFFVFHSRKGVDIRSSNHVQYCILQQLGFSWWNLIQHLIFCVLQITDRQNTPLGHEVRSGWQTVSLCLAAFIYSFWNLSPQLNEHKKKNES